MIRHETTLPLLRGSTTLELALEQEEDILLELGFPEQRIDFFVSLYSNRDDNENIDYIILPRSKFFRNLPI